MKSAARHKRQAELRAWVAGFVAAAPPTKEQQQDANALLDAADKQEDFRGTTVSMDQRQEVYKKLKDCCGGSNKDRRLKAADEARKAAKKKERGANKFFKTLKAKLSPSGEFEPGDFDPKTKVWGPPSSGTWWKLQEANEDSGAPGYLLEKLFTSKLIRGVWVCIQAMNTDGPWKYSFVGEPRGGTLNKRFRDWAKGLKTKNGDKSLMYSGKLSVEDKNKAIAAFNAESKALFEKTAALVLGLDEPQTLCVHKFQAPLRTLKDAANVKGAPTTSFRVVSASVSVATSPGSKTITEDSRKMAASPVVGHAMKWFVGAGILDKSPLQRSVTPDNRADAKVNPLDAEVVLHKATGEKGDWLAKDTDTFH